MPTIEATRRKLYERAWQTPMVKLAASSACPTADSQSSARVLDSGSRARTPGANQGGLLNGAGTGLAPRAEA